MRAFDALIRAVAKGNSAKARMLLEESPALAHEAATEGATRLTAPQFYHKEISHYLYEGDTALHLASAGLRVDLVRELLSRGADPNARNRRGASPLHYAADGGPPLPHWDSEAQAAVIDLLLKAGADPNLADNDKVTPLHRAARTRCASAVQTLVAGGADLSARNKNGSTPVEVAAGTTGRRGAGTSEAKAQQRQILELFRVGHARSPRSK